MCAGLVKSAALRGSGRDVNTDERAAVAAEITTGGVDDILRLIYPACYRVDDAAGGWGREGGDDPGGVPLPPTTPAGLEYFDPSGAYLIDNGRLAVLWLGSATPPAFYDAAFGPGAAGRDPSTLALAAPPGGGELAARIAAVLRRLRRRRELHQTLHVVRQGTPMEAHVTPYFVEDARGAAGPAPGYLDWMLLLQKMVLSKG